MRLRRLPCLGFARRDFSKTYCPEKEYQQQRFAMTSNNASPKRPTGGVKGLDEYSQFMDLSPELVAFKRFGRLSIRNLLALQAQLQALQCEIDEVDSEEERTLESGTINEKMKLLQVNVDWRSFERAAKTPGNDRARRKMEKTLQLGKLLDQYCPSLHVLTFIKKC